MRPLTILQKARECIADPAGWWDGTDATSGAGSTCAWLAFDEVTAIDGDDARHDAENALLRVIGRERPEDIAKFNDSHTHAEVLAAFDRAIAAEGAK